MSAQSSKNSKLRNPLADEAVTSRSRALTRDHLRLVRLDRELSEANSQLAKYKELYMRQRAEMENYSKAMEREKTLITKNASRNVIKDLLPLLDSFDSAISASKGDGNIVAMHNQLVKILSAYGFSSIDAKGKKFDPYQHEVIAVNQSNEDGTVLEEVQKGYKLNEEIIRTSKVIVGKKGE